MKNFRFLVVIMVVSIFLLGLPAPAQAAAEIWTADPATGGKIGLMFMVDGCTVLSVSWSGPVIGGKAEGKGQLNYAYKEKNGTEYKVQADGEMKAGKLDGKVSIKYSDGEAYDGDYKDGLREGKGAYKFVDGRTYEGDWKAGKMEGYGVGRGPDGKVLHDGQWKDGLPVEKPKTEMVLGIPWGATEEQADAIMKKRPGTTFFWVDNRYTPPPRTYGTKYNDMDAFANIFFHQGKMYRVQVIVSSSDDAVAKQYEEIKAGLTERYGKPFEEKGKYLDSQATFDLGAGYAANIAIGTHSGIYKNMPSFRCVVVSYYHGPTAKIVEGAGSKAKADY